MTRSRKPYHFLQLPNYFRCIRWKAALSLGTWIRHPYFRRFFLRLTNCQKGEMGFFVPTLFSRYEQLKSVEGWQFSYWAVSRRLSYSNRILRSYREACLSDDHVELSDDNVASWCDLVVWLLSRDFCGRRSDRQHKKRTHLHFLATMSVDGPASSSKTSSSLWAADVFTAAPISFIDDDVGKMCVYLWATWLSKDSLSKNREKIPAVPELVSQTM